jgi:dTDP-4-amino-4,6-dideoxygalactose transaminase
LLEAPVRIPIFDPRPQLEELWDEIMAAIERVLRSGQFILGPEVEAFEREVAAYLGVKHAIGVNSGTDALIIALHALGIGPGDEVITTPFTFFATAEAISRVDATPVFVDIEPRTFNINPELIEPAITPRTRAILPVHLYGHPADMDPIMEIARTYNLKVVEDAAQAFGALYKGKKAGTIGDVGCFSFFPTKNLGAFGDGGLIATNDNEVADRARMLRVHGAQKKYYHEMIGYNSRLDELQAAVLRVKLPFVDAWNEARRRAAACYNLLLAGVPEILLPTETANALHVYHQYTIRLEPVARRRVLDALGRAAVAVATYYPVPLHLLPPYSGRSWRLPESEVAAAQVLSLPIWPQIAPETQERVARVILEVLCAS